MYEIFAELLKTYNVTRYQVSKATGVPQSSLSDWSKGKSKPKYENMKRIADYFGVSVEYLLGNEKQKTPATDSDGLTEQDKKDSAVELEQLMQEMQSSGDLMFDGEPATPEAMESLRQAMQLGLTYAKKINKGK